MSLWAFLATIALVRSAIFTYLPESVRLFISSHFQPWVSRFLDCWTSRFSRDMTMVVPDYQPSSKLNNQLFQAANLYLGETALPTLSVPRVVVGKTHNLKNLSFDMDNNSEVIDVFENVAMRWRYRIESTQNQGVKRRYELSFPKEHKEMVTKSYLPHILETMKNIMDKNRVVKLHTAAAYGAWSPGAVTINHPMTFETLAMDGDLKKVIVEDLDRFISGKEYYRQIGKVWKRGYLLYGPPGTGKSSLIAAMANHLNFDIYNLDLSTVSSNLILQNLMLTMANRSILVIEDIDCSVQLQNRESKVEQQQSKLEQQHKPKKNKVKMTLSGLLNFFDGILSCCGEGNILVVTTNYKDRLDPALLRAGRMDMHIHLTNCTFSAFKQLAFKYLGISDHTLFHNIEKLLPKAKVSPAEVAGELMKTRDADASLNGLIKHIKQKLLADKNSEVSRPLASKVTSKDNAKSLAPKPDVPTDEEKASTESNILGEGSSNNTDNKSLIQLGQSSTITNPATDSSMEKKLSS